MRWTLASVVAVALFAAGCGDAFISGAGGGAAGGAGGAGGSGATTGLPCAVANVLEAKCLSCHGATPAGGAPYSLVSLADLSGAAPAPYTGQTKAQRSVARMQAGTMPPGGGATAAEIDALQAWVAANMPAGTCGPPDAGPTTCASGSRWAGGNTPSEDMNPGLACRACHLQLASVEKRYSFSGTVFPALHEANLCDARVSGNAVVEIVDHTGAVALTLPVMQSGNFYSPTVWSTPAFPLPYTARVVNGARTAAMTTPQTDGDCNACHSEQGSGGAPGRIVLP